uniref:Putative secreted peptide n=1 Tax=Anopheles braziliensis TaxID=58242 RepID=A0A2M3ZPI2_9DIPT
MLLKAHICLRSALVLSLSPVKGRPFAFLFRGFFFVFDFSCFPCSVETTCMMKSKSMSILTSDCYQNTQSR